VDPVQGFLERRRPVERVHPVVIERPAHGRQERRRQSFPFDVERTEISVQVLL
jgi:hypothetical protein